MGALLIAGIFTSKKCEFVFSDENRHWIESLKNNVPIRSEHLWILSSGTGRAHSAKVIAHRKEGFLLAAENANAHLNVTNKDIWLNILPTYHVGGLAIHARSFLSGSKVIEPKMAKWDARKFCDLIRSSGATLTSLVPTQIFDLVHQNLPVPMCLRGVVVGGGALSERLYQQARDLGWPLLPSYGLTECASQVATASLESLGAHKFPELKLLPHIQLKIVDRKIQIHTVAMADWVCVLRQDGSRTLEMAAPYGWLKTEDLGTLQRFGLKVLGREGEFVKVLGTLVNLPDIEERVLAVSSGLGFKGLIAIVPVADERREHSLMLVLEDPDKFGMWNKLRSECNQVLSGPERLSTIAWVQKIPVSSLKKIKRQELLALLSL